jgi:hypothetical protein
MIIDLMDTVLSFNNDNHPKMLEFYEVLKKKTK